MALSRVSSCVSSQVAPNALTWSASDNTERVSTSTPAVRRYLGEFLSDRRVVDPAIVQQVWQDFAPYRAAGR